MQVIVGHVNTVERAMTIAQHISRRQHTLTWYSRHCEPDDKSTASRQARTR